MSGTTLHRAETLAVSIARPPEVVYAFVSDPSNLPRWAAGLGRSVRMENGECTVETPAGPATVRFAARNELGVLDHRVRLPDGSVVYVPMRVVPNSEGSELLFTLFQLPGMTAEAFANDAKAVTRDLQALKALLEQP